ncbi:MAG TPA: hypothetical protein VMS30_02220 [Phycisphaerales bacterium]|nr:hypothetical protein [Phycisphaerales bacterium]
MMSLRDRLICCLLAASFPGHSLLAMGMLPRPLAMPAATVVAIAPAPSAAPAAPPAGGWMPSTLCPFTIVPLASVSPAFIEQQRAAITSQLVGLGYDLGAADGMASELTAEDLAVLLANPKMMQKAGEMDDSLFVLVCVVVVIGAVVALAILADESTIIIDT